MRHVIKSGISLFFLVVALAALPALARDHGRGHDRDRDRDRYSHDDRGHHHNGKHRHYQRHYYAPPRVVYYAPPRVVYRPVYRPVYRSAYGPPRWTRGVRYYDRGYGPTYVVDDYRGYGLRAPPRGHYWRRSDAGDYLLVAVATGIIADLILRN